MTTAIHPIAPPPVRPARIRLPRIFVRPDPSPAAATQTPDLHFVDMAALYKPLLWLFGKLGAHTLWCPVAIRGQKPDALPALSVIGRAVGFGDDRSQRLLDHHHERRLLRRRASVVPLEFVLQPLLLVFVHVPWLLEPPPLKSRSLAVEIGTWTLFLLAEFSLIVMAGIIVRRFAELLLDRHFAESICATQALYLLTQLHREDVLARADHRRDLIARFDGLARATRLLALRYRSSEPAIREKVQRHFKEITRYITERRMWAVTPVATTLDDLKRDMRELTRIFIAGTYGEFRWSVETEDPAKAVVPAWKSAMRGLGRTIALLAPFAALGYLLVSPQAQQTYGGTGVMLVLVSWALISVDTVLELGLVTSVVGLAKSIKELK